MTNQNKNNLNPNFVTGFADGESSFLINITPRPKTKTGYYISLAFKIKLHSKDRALLENIRNYFGQVGTITVRKDGYIEYIVASIKDLEVIINHFASYPLITQKRSDYQLFKQVFELIKHKEHLTMEGLKKTLSIKAVLNNGLSDQLKAAFPDIAPVERPKFDVPEIVDLNWLVGFTEAEGCFFVKISKSKTTNSGFVIQLKFKVTQHSRDAELMNKLGYFFGCGFYYARPKESVGDFAVTRINEIIDKIIPFFDKYPLQGAKALDYSDFRKIAYLMKDRVHFTVEGIEQIQQIKSGMNTGRNR